MEINLHNYEAFFLDYKEGNLSATQEKVLFLFLEEHPHLYEELHAFENITLEHLGVEEIFSGKNSIKKTNYNSENLIAYTEGILDTKTKNEIDVLALQNQALKKELALYASTHLQADLNEKFKNKSKLKRGGVVILLQSNYTFLRVAAAILLLIGLFFLVSNLNSEKEVKNKSVVADISNKPAIDSQQVGAEARQPINNKQEVVPTKQLAANNNAEKNSSANKVQESRKEIVPQPEKQNIVKNELPVNEQPINNSAPDKIDSVIKTIVVKNNSQNESKNLNGSYFNSSVDDKDEEPVTASVNVEKKSFFQKLVKVAKNINSLGVKNVKASEESDANSVSVGSFVLTQTTSN